MQNTDPHAPNPATEDSAATGGDERNAEIEALTIRLVQAEGELAQMREIVLRERAEIENQRRRLQRDLDQARRFANEKILADLLPVFDGLDRGLAIETDDVATLREGMELTLKSLDKLGQTHGLKVIDPLHQPFNPDHHQAMSMVQSREFEPNTVVAVLQKGFVLNDRLLRPALVAVAKEAE
jgi:molecular chaperone GrpE